MSSVRTLLLASVVAVSFLAGCADEAPSGDIAASAPSVSFDHAVVDIDYHPFENGFDPGFPEDPTGTLDPAALCVLEAVTGLDPTGTLPVCSDAFTAINVTLHGAPDVGGKAYTLFLVGDEELNVGPLVASPDDGLELSVSYDEDLSGMYSGAELRVDDFVVATSGVAGGSNNLDIALGSPSFSGSWEGNVLNLDVSGLQENATFQGWLVLEDQDTLELVHDVQFPVANGAVEFEAPEDLDHWDYVHIHVAGTSINVGISEI